MAKMKGEEIKGRMGVWFEIQTGFQVKPSRKEIAAHTQAILLGLKFANDFPM